MPVRTDDTELSDDEMLWRRIIDTPGEWFVKETDGSLTVSSAAFKDSQNEVSVNVVAQTTQEAVMTQGRASDGLVRLAVQVPRSLNHIVAKTLEADDPEDPSHRVICPPKELLANKKQRMKAARAMARSATWDLYPASARQEADS